MQHLSGRKRIFLIEPLDYITFINLMKCSYIVLTDSGGIQEEAPALRKPLLVLRKLTERPEAFQVGLAKIVGTSQKAIIEETSRLLINDKAYQEMSRGLNPYGDGKASERITEAIHRWSCGMTMLSGETYEFQFPFAA